jgi:hypothetical protein
MTPTLTADWGELAHPVRTDDPGEGKPVWKDNAYLCFWDRATKAHGVIHVSTSPNAEGRRARASLSVNGRADEVAETLDSGSFESDSISFGLDGPIAVNAGGLRAELFHEPRGRGCDYSDTGTVPELVEGEPLQHFQGAARVTGTMEVTGETIEVNGVGLRDRTWGFRDESAMWPEYIGVAVELGDRFLTVMKFADMEYNAASSGFILSDSDPVPTTGLEEITRDASGLFAAATVSSEAGETIELRMTDRFGGFWVPMGWTRQGPTMSAYDELIEVTTGGGEVGYGLVEQGVIRKLA